MGKSDVCRNEYRKMANVIEIPIECDVEPIEKLQKNGRVKELQLQYLRQLLV